MNKTKRKIINIDPEKCNGCGQCVLACAEGAIQIVNGKATLINETYCDGLGACIGDCPENALTIVEEDVLPFDEAAVDKHLKAKESMTAPCSCPGAKTMTLSHQENKCSETNHPWAVSSQLNNWPVQLMLLPVQAPFLHQANLLISADCVPFAYASFHQRFLKDKVAITLCPKLDPHIDHYREKLTAIIDANNIESITIVHMEVPCCFGLAKIVSEAVKKANKPVIIKEYTVSINGQII